jgi:hypothetical protein
LDGTELCFYLLLSYKISPNKERDRVRSKDDGLSKLRDFGTTLGVELSFLSNYGGYQFCHAGVLLLTILNKGFETIGDGFIVNLLALMLEVAWR